MSACVENDNVPLNVSLVSSNGCSDVVGAADGSYSLGDAKEVVISDISTDSSMDQHCTGDFSTCIGVGQGFSQDVSSDSGTISVLDAQCQTDGIVHFFIDDSAEDVVTPASAEDQTACDLAASHGIDEKLRTLQVVACNDRSWVEEDGSIDLDHLRDTLVFQLLPESSISVVNATFEEHSLQWWRHLHMEFQLLNLLDKKFQDKCDEVFDSFGGTTEEEGSDVSG